MNPWFCNHEYVAQFTIHWFAKFFKVLQVILNTSLASPTDYCSAYNRSNFCKVAGASFVDSSQTKAIFLSSDQFVHHELGEFVWQQSIPALNVDPFCFFISNHLSLKLKKEKDNIEKEKLAYRS